MAKVKFRKYIQIADKEVLAVFYAPGDSDPIIEVPYLEIPIGMKINIGDKIVIEDGKVRKASAEEKKSWWRF